MYRKCSLGETDGSLCEPVMAVRPGQVAGQVGRAFQAEKGRSHVVRGNRRRRRSV